MSLRGLDEFITGQYGESYWNRETPESEHDFVCGFCRSGACAWCLGKRCDCSGRYGRTAAQHGPYQGPVKLVHDVGETVRRSATWDNGRQLPTASHRNSATPGSPTPKPQIEERLHMDAVPALTGMIKFSREQVELIKSTVAVGATDAELELFRQVCEARGLNPFLKQIYCIKRKQKRDGKWVEVMVHQTGIDGFRLIAERTGKYVGQLGPYFTEDGINWIDAWVKETPPAAAKVGILRKDFKEPVWAMARYAAYCPRDENGKIFPTGVWRNNPEGQTAKCAEALGFRRAFPEELSGLYTNDEMNQAEEPSYYDAEIKVIDTNSQPHSDPEREVRPEKRAVTTDGSQASAEHFHEVMPGVELSVSGEADGKLGVVVDGTLQPQSPLGLPPDAPADDNDKKMLGDLYKAASQRVGSVNAFKHLDSKKMWPIADLRKNQVEACAEALQSL